ncbi:MAG: helix-turn-helix domain-containing protein [Verrucomicrobia bacterium]|nr:helix-turn-helix domain-containing protein [Verrucomicrobiota bacterium]
MKRQVTSGHVVPKLALSRVEAAEAIGVTPVTVDRLAKRGLLRPSRATRRPLYPIWEIERFLRETSQSIEIESLRSARSEEGQ